MYKNVMLFAAHKCFADHHVSQLKEFIRTLTEDLNFSDNEPEFLHYSGSELALDVLQSGCAAGSPNALKHLMRIALQLIDRSVVPGVSVDDAGVDGRLASLYCDRTAAIFQTKIQDRIRQRRVHDSLVAWPLLFRLTLEGVQWARDLCIECWPEKLDDLHEIASFVGRIPVSDTVADALARSLLSSTPLNARLLLRRWDRNVVVQRTIIDELWEICGTGMCEKMDIPIKVSESARYSCGFGLNRDLLPGKKDFLCHLFELFPVCHRSWLPLRYLSKCGNVFTYQGLFDILNCLLSDPEFKGTDSFLLGILPWPMAVALKGCSTRQQLRALIAQIGDRARQSMPDSLATSLEWMQAGIDPGTEFQPDDLLNLVESTSDNQYVPELALSFSWSKIKPFSGNQSQISNESSTFHHALIGAKHTAVRSLLADSVLHYSWLPQAVLPRHLRSALRVANPGNILQINPPRLSDCNDRDVAEWVVFFAAIGNERRLSSQVYFSTQGQVSEEWLQLLEAHYTKAAQKSGSVGTIRKHRAIGLLHFLSGRACAGLSMYTVPREVLQFGRFCDCEQVFAALLVRISQQDLVSSEVDSAIETLLELMADQTKTWVPFNLFSALEKHLVDNQPLKELLLRLRAKIPEHVRFGRAHCDRLLRRMYEFQPSPLHEPHALRQLKLPDVTNLVFEYPDRPELT